MMKLGLKGLLLLLAIVLFIVGALSDGSTRVDLLYWGLAVFAGALIVDSLPLAKGWGDGENRT